MVGGFKGLPGRRLPALLCLSAGRQPVQHLLQHLRAAQQRRVAGAVGNVSGSLCKFQAALRVLVLPRRAVQGQQAVTNEVICQPATLG
jgi:hypothetical protein